MYTAIASLDGFVEDRDGNFGWAEPGEEVHRFVNDIERGIGTNLYGRRMYETMAAWETDESLAAESPYTRDYAEIWQAADKIVYSRTLDEPVTRRTRIEREFDPDAVRAMKGSARSDLGVGGPNLASRAFAAGLVDECHLFVVPIIVGGGKAAFPDGVHLELALVSLRHFANGFAHLHYRRWA